VIGPAYSPQSPRRVFPGDDAHRRWRLRAPKPTSTSTPCPTPLRSPRSAFRLRCSRKRVSTRPAWHTARRRGVPDYSPEGRRRADQRARQQPSGEHSDHCRAQGPGWDSLSLSESTTKDGAGGFPLAPWPKPASNWRERAGRKAPTPAHKRAMTKTLLGLIATFRVWLAPPELPRPL
jgi:hypothetical protein